MTTKFKSFAEFGKTVKQERVDNLKQQVDSIFEKSIKDDFDSIPVGSFKSNLPEINSISFIRPDSENGDVLYAVIFSKNKEGVKTSHNWAILRNGNIYPKDKIPTELGKYQQEEIALEIAGLLERIGPSFIHLTDLDVIPLQDEGESREASSGPRGPSIEKPIDPAREQFLQSQRGARFEFANRDIGFKGYKGLLFDKFIYLENPYKDNAAFMVDLPERIDFEIIEKELIAKKSEADEELKVSKDEIRKEVLRRYWEPISKKAKTRKELVALGAQRFVHTPETWQENIRKAIESRMN